MNRLITLVEGYSCCVDDIAKHKQLQDIEEHIKLKYRLDSQLPSPCTPKQYKEITGKDWPDGCLVLKLGLFGDWRPVEYWHVKHEPNLVIVQTGQGAPIPTWRSDKEGE